MAEVQIWWWSWSANLIFVLEVSQEAVPKLIFFIIIAIRTYWQISHFSIMSYSNPSLQVRLQLRIAELSPTQVNKTLKFIR